MDQHAATAPRHAQQPDLSHVGLVLWQSGYVLADFLLLRLPAAGGALGSSRDGGVAGGSSGSWAGVRVLELGCGGGTVGMFLALAGAQVSPLLCTGAAQSDWLSADAENRQPCGSSHIWALPACRLCCMCRWC